jgi:hypothetical protein
VSTQTLWPVGLVCTLHPPLGFFPLWLATGHQMHGFFRLSIRPSYQRRPAALRHQRPVCRLAPRQLSVNPADAGSEDIMGNYQASDTAAPLMLTPYAKTSRFFSSMDEEIVNALTVRL